MVPSGAPTPRCRPKRAAASKAEGVISEALSGSVDKTDERKAQLCATTEFVKNAPSEAPPPMGWLQQKMGRSSKRVEKGSAQKVSETPSRQKTCSTTTLKADKFEVPSCGGRRKYERTKPGTKRGPERGDRPLKSSRVGPTEQPRVKPKPPQGWCGIARLMDRFAGGGSPKFDVPTNPTMGDAWKVLDVVLADLPSTAPLKLDALVDIAGGHSSTENVSDTKRSNQGSGVGGADALSTQQSVSMVIFWCKQ